MQPRLNGKLATLIALSFVLAIACNSFSPFYEPTPSHLLATPTGTPVDEILHFENDLLSFSYPARLQIFAGEDPAFLPYPGKIRLGGELVVGLVDPNWIKSETLDRRTCLQAALP